MTAEVAAYNTSLETVQPNRQPAQYEPWQQDQDKQAQAYNANTANLLRQKGLRNIAERLESCGTVFGYWACRHDGTPGRMVKSFCGQDRLCPTCARIRRRRLIDEILQCAGRINSKPVAGFSWRTFTLPVKTDRNYRAAAKTALNAFSKLWRQGLFKGGAGQPVACLLHLENGPQTGNVHLHGLHYGPYVAQSELSVAWSKLTGSSVVDVRAAVRSEGKDVVGEVAEHQLRQAIAESVKYLTKFSECSNERLVELWESNKGLKLFRRYGLFRTDVLNRWVPVALVYVESEPELVCAVCGRSHWAYVSLQSAGRAPPGCIQGTEHSKRKLTAVERLERQFGRMSVDGNGRLVLGD